MEWKRVLCTRSSSEVCKGMNRMNNPIRVAILGYGNLGRGVELALRANPDMKLVAFFTRRAPDTLKTLTPEVPVYHVDDLEHFLAENRVDVGLLAVPIPVAQQMSDRLIAAGVRGIWNFTNGEIVHDSPDVVVESVHFSDSLLALSYMVAQKEEEEKPSDEGELL